MLKIFNYIIEVSGNKSTKTFIIFTVIEFKFV